MRYCVWLCVPPTTTPFSILLSLCVTVSLSLSVSPSPFSLTFAPFFPPPHLFQCLSFPSLPLQGQLHCILQMSGLIVYKHRTVLVKMHNLSICASWYSWIYLQVPVFYFFFLPVSMVYITVMPIFLWEFQIRIKI